MSHKIGKDELMGDRKEEEERLIRSAQGGKGKRQKSKLRFRERANERMQEWYWWMLSARRDEKETDYPADEWEREWVRREAEEIDVRFTMNAQNMYWKEKKTSRRESEWKWEYDNPGFQQQQQQQEKTWKMNERGLVGVSVVEKSTTKCEKREVSDISN